MTTMAFDGGPALVKALHVIGDRMRGKVLREALEEAAEPMRASMARLAPREPGAPDIADNMVISRVTKIDGDRLLDTEVAVAVGPAKGYFYGCVFDPRTYVATDRGSRAICQIKVGDRVLTQTGEFRSVVATNKYPAQEKPELVTIVAAYRKGSGHKLTLTRDHKVLVFRDGKFQWLAAGLLVTGDVLSRRTKQSWSQGTAVVEQRTCERCAGIYERRNRGRVKMTDGQSTGKRFCSTACRSAWLAERHRGMQRSDRAKAIMSASSKLRMERNPESHPNRIMATKGYRTVNEKVVADWLETRGVAFKSQHKIGSAFVDFYLPDTKTVIETDGAYWHRNQQRDIDRDKRILAHQPGAKIVHMHFVDPRFTPPVLDRQPLPNVAYVPCNPGPSSFVDPSTFSDVAVKSVTHWRYEARRGQCSYLYDITVEGVPSFVASGIVIHNSFLEFGTAKMSARPFMRPSWDQHAPKALVIIGQALWRELAALGIGRSGVSSGPVSGGGGGSTL